MRLMLDIKGIEPLDLKMVNNMLLLSTGFYRFLVGSSYLTSIIQLSCSDFLCMFFYFSFVGLAF